MYAPRLACNPNLTLRQESQNIGLCILTFGLNPPKSAQTISRCFSLHGAPTKATTGPLREQTLQTFFLLAPYGPPPEIEISKKTAGGQRQPRADRRLRLSCDLLRVGQSQRAKTLCRPGYPPLILATYESPSDYALRPAPLFHPLPYTPRPYSGKPSATRVSDSHYEGASTQPINVSNGNVQGLH